MENMLRGRLGWEAGGAALGVWDVGRMGKRSPRRIFLKRWVHTSLPMSGREASERPARGGTRGPAKDINSEGS